MTEADRLARELFEARRELRRAGRVLHDDVGSSLSAIGVRLQLAQVDYPESAHALTDAITALDEAMNSLRTLSRQLNSSPAATIGLERALFQLAEDRAAGSDKTIRVSYAARATMPPDSAAAMYQAIAAVLDFFVQDRSSTRVEVAVKGSRKIAALIASNGRSRWPRSAVLAEARRARPAGIFLEAATENGTIVSIQYAPGRSPRG